MNTHTKNKIYTCNLCDKSFTQKNSLKIHMLVNTGVKAYKCKACKRKFSRKENLKRHVKLQKTGKQILQNVTFVKRKTAYLEFRFRLLFKNFCRKKYMFMQNVENGLLKLFRRVLDLLNRNLFYKFKCNVLVWFSIL